MKGHNSMSIRAVMLVGVIVASRIAAEEPVAPADRPAVKVPAQASTADIMKIVGLHADHPAVKMPANSWLEIPNTKMKTVAFPRGNNPKVDLIGGSGAVINAWSGAALDTKRNRLVLFGGGHGDYAGNELYTFDLTKLVWERLTEPYPDPKSDDSDENPDGTPQSRHTYFGLAYLTHNNRFFALGGAIAGSGLDKCNKIWTFDFTTKKWAREKDKVPCPVIQDCLCTYDPMTRKLWWGAKDIGNWGHLYSYDFNTEKWIKHVGGETMYRAGALDTKRGQLVMLQGPNKATAYDVRSDKFVSEVWKTTGGEEFENLIEAGFEYDPVADKLVGTAKGKRCTFSIRRQKSGWSTIRQMDLRDDLGDPSAAGVTCPA